ncbi:MAG: hypothetical protein VXZ59_06140 [Cyanobacteriota bacterium]|nr:hypothetical protein [Cyanobacteriota bacterium]
MQFARIEKALQAPVMDAVIALTERFQNLEAKPNAMVFTFLRSIDQSLAIGYSEELSSVQNDFEARGYQLVEARRGTRREERLLLLTLKEIGLQTTYSNNYFEATATVIRHLKQLGWPMGDLRTNHPRKRQDKRTDHLVEDN